VVDDATLAPQQRSDPAVTVSPMSQGQPLHNAPQLGLFAERRGPLPVAIIGCPAYFGQPAHPLN
jgi:hypothetical protein